MFSDLESIKKIKSLGLNTYEVKIWTALLSRGTSTAGELSDIANVPRSRSYDVLESLEKKGFVLMKLGKPIKYHAVPPKEVLERVKKIIEKKADAHISKISGQTFTNLINNLQEIHENSSDHSQNIAAVLKGSSNIDKHLRFLIKHSQKEVLMSIEKEKEKYLNMLAYKAKSVSAKTKNLGFRLCLVDDNMMIFPVRETDTHPDYDLSVWIKNKQLTGFMRKLLISA